MSKKYELLLNDTKKARSGKTLYRIRALRDFDAGAGTRWKYPVRAGDLGGHIESEANLSHEGTAWVGHNARVLDDACVYEDALVYGYEVICGIAKVGGQRVLFSDENPVISNAGIVWYVKIGSEDGDAIIFRDKEGNFGVTSEILKYQESEIFPRATGKNDGEIDFYRL